MVHIFRQTGTYSLPTIISWSIGRLQCGGCALLKQSRNVLSGQQASDFQSLECNSGRTVLITAEANLFLFCTAFHWGFQSLQHEWEWIGQRTFLKDCYVEIGNDRKMLRVLYHATVRQPDSLISQGESQVEHTVFLEEDDLFLLAPTKVSC